MGERHASQTRGVVTDSEAAASTDVINYSLDVEEPRSHAGKWTKFIPCIKFIMGLCEDEKLREEPSTDTKELRTVGGSLVGAEGM